MILRRIKRVLHSDRIAPTFTPMKRASHDLPRKSGILLVIILGLQMPWASIDFCVAHPLGEPHHHGLSNCQKRALWKGGPAVWPPMHCLKFAMHSDNYAGPESVVVERTAEVVLPIWTDLIVTRPKADQEYRVEPEQRCRSHPLIPGLALRGPPSACPVQAG